MVHPRSTSKLAASVLSLFVLGFLVAAVYGAPCPPVQPKPFVYDKRGPLRNVFFFTDGSNFDDDICLQILLKSNKTNLLGIYAQGNAWGNPAPTARNFQNILHLHGYNNISVLQGSFFALQDEADAAASGKPPVQTYRSFIPQDSLMLSDSLWGLDKHLPQSPRAYDPITFGPTDANSLASFVSIVENLPLNQKISIFSTGTLTPLAKLFRLYSRDRLKNLMKRIDGVWLMGGAVNTAGNIFSYAPNTAAEFNIMNDPHAAQYAFTNFTSYGVDITLVPLDATNTAPFSQTLLDNLYGNPQTPEAQFAGQLMSRLRANWFAPEIFYLTAFLWDPTSALVMLEPGVVSSSNTEWIKVITDQGAFGTLQGATRVCSSQEASLSNTNNIKNNNGNGSAPLEPLPCARVKVVYSVYGDRVNKLVEDYLQAPANSAVRPLVCV